jgi:hypothetical protein
MKQLLLTMALAGMLFTGACSQTADSATDTEGQQKDMASEALECVPACDGAQCGDDGCDGVCGQCPSGQSCEGGQCTPENRCEDNEECDDGDPCTSGDTCTDGACAGTTYSCSDQKDCTADDCDGQGECNFKVMAGHCLINGICYEDGDFHSANTCRECTAAVSKTEWSNDDTNECTDGNECLVGDYCDSGTCVPGTEDVDCEDDNPCTQESCEDASGCVYEKLSGDCDDADACTVHDECEEGECVGVAVDCEDGNLCTEDSCDAQTGCAYAIVPGDCDDGDACTLGDVCLDGECLPGDEELDCDDDNQCTTDSCSPEDGCVHEDNTDDCDDGDPCSLGDTCVEGECLPGGDLFDCGDGNPCTEEQCDPGEGCQYEEVAGDCEDGDVCTQGDFCQAGQCLPGPEPADCDDADPCTQDLCDPVGGCSHAKFDGDCDDGNPCTDNETCVNGACIGAVKVCDDTNVCTADTCNPYVEDGCVFAPQGGSCDDGDVCTVGDSCSAGECQPGANEPDCDDSNECTTDVCQSPTGCKHINAVGFCDDGNSCTQGDYCANGTCISGANACPCDDDADCAAQDDDDLCNGILNCDKSSPNPAMWMCKVAPASVVSCPPAASICKVTFCVPQTGECVTASGNESAACDDNDVCTDGEKCHGGDCLGGALVNCDDTEECTVDTCHSAQGCLFAPVQDGTACAGQGWTCQMGQCTHCAPNCTGKDCGPNGCGGFCGTCPGDETCTAQGTCVSECVGCAPWQDCLDGVCTDPPVTDTCPGGGEQIGSFCHDIGLAGCCGGSDALYYCGWNQECPWGMGSCLCRIKCSGNMVCGFDYQNDFFNCLWPPAQANPYGELYCGWYVCEPDCQGKECGGDGCGGSCGTCQWDEVCVDGECDPQGVPSCNGTATWSYSSCQGLGFEGCCDPWGRVLWCENNKLYCLDCAAGPSCGWHGSEGYYDCQTNGGSDPTGQHPKACPCFPPCSSGYSCVNGLCQ